MPRGVNKRVIEITQTGTPAFERIYFVVSPGALKLKTGDLKHQAHSYIQNERVRQGLQVYHFSPGKMRPWVYCAITFLATGVLAAVAALLLGVF